MPELPKSTELVIAGVTDTRTPAGGIPTLPYMDRKIAEAKEEAKKETLAGAVQAKLAAWIGAGVLGAVTLGGVALAYDKLEDKASDAGTKAAQVQLAPVVEAVKGLDVRMSTLEQQRLGDRSEQNSRFERLERQGNRIEEKLDAQLRANGIPNPAPTPKDAGR